MGRRTAPLAGTLLSVVALLLAQTPSSAADTMAGAGALTATISYSQGGIPIAPHACVPNATWTFNGSAPAGVVAQLVNDEYAGPLTITASGTSPCADSSLEFGSLPAASGPAVTITGTNSINGSTIACANPASPLTGQSLRVGLHLHIAVQGNCTINSNTPAFAIIAIEGELVPAAGTVPLPGSVVSQWQFVGAFALDVL
jgi:hypothetical protein